MAGTSHFAASAVTAAGVVVPEIFAWIFLAAVGCVVLIQPHFVAAIGAVHKPA